MSLRWWEFCKYLLLKKRQDGWLSGISPVIEHYGVIDTNIVNLHWSRSNVFKELSNLDFLTVSLLFNIVHTSSGTRNSPHFAGSPQFQLELQRMPQSNRTRYLKTVPDRNRSGAVWRNSIRLLWIFHIILFSIPIVPFSSSSSLVGSAAGVGTIRQTDSARCLVPTFHEISQDPLRLCPPPAHHPHGQSRWLISFDKGKQSRDSAFADLWVIIFHSSS